MSFETIPAVQRGELDCAHALNDREAIDGLEVRRLGAIDLVVTMPMTMAEPSRPCAPW